MQKSKSIERMVMLGFGASLSFLFLVCGFAWHSSHKADEAAQWVAHTHEVIATLELVASSAYHAESAQRAYFLTSKESPHLRDRSQALQALHLAMQKLQTLTADNAVQQSLDQILQDQVQKRRDLLDAHLDMYMRLGSNGLQAIREDFGASVSQMSSVLQVINEMRNREQLLLRQREEENAHQNYIKTASFIALVPLLLALLFFLMHRIRQDIRLRSQAEAEQRKLIDILDATPDLVAMSNGELKLTYLNKAGRMMLGLNEHQDLSAISVSSIHPSQHIDTLGEDRFAHAIRFGSWRGETTFLSRDGTEIPTLQVVMSHRQPDGSFQFSTIAHDISERRDIEETLRMAANYESSQSLALSIFNSSFDRQEILDKTLRLLAERHAFPASSIHLHDEWHGCYTLTASHGAPEDIKEAFRNSEGLAGEAAASQQSLLLHDTSAVGGMRLEAGIATLLPAAILITPILYQGRTLGVMSLASSKPLTARDQSFIERLCNQLGIALHNLKLYADTRLLAEQLRVGSEEIARKNDELEKASRTKSEFLANMSHELRTPLNAVVGFSEVLKDGLLGTLPEQQLEYVTDIFNSGKHLLSLINDILDLSKVESGKMELAIELLNLPELLSNSLIIVKEKAAAHHIQIELDIASDLEWIQADERKLKQVIYNLLSNAIKFSKDHGSIKLQARKVEHSQVGLFDPTIPNRTLPLPSSTSQQAFLELSITDSGIGISPDGLARLFQPFMQVDGGLARKFEGTGLGLMLVMRMIELHGGTIGVASQEGSGSCFTIWLPLHSGAAMPKTLPKALSENPHPVRGNLVLVVEDDDKAAELIRLQLESEGLKVIRSKTAEEALSLATQHQFSLITLDLLLPGMDGWEFLACIKDNPKTANLPVVIISLVADSNRGLSLGASAILQKPVTQETLLTTLDELGMSVSPDVVLNVLVIDDDPRSVEIITMHLQQANCTVLRAYGGKDGIAMATTMKPELIVLDLMMPEVSGFEVVEVLKGNPDTARIPILVVTAKQIEAADRATLNGHVMKIIEKSDFNHGRFISEVRRVLGTTKRGG